MPGIGNTSQMNGDSPNINTPSLFDLTEFPSLSNRNRDDNVSQPSSTPRVIPYGGMMRQPPLEASEFTLSSEDFPALPGTHNNDDVESSSPDTSLSGDEASSSDMLSGDEGSDGDSRQGQESTKSENITFVDEKMKNIPDSMINDQFGIAGLLSYIRTAEKDPDLVTLALGQDLSTLDLDLDSPQLLYPTFGGPWAEQPCPPEDVDPQVPPEYVFNTSIRNKLKRDKLDKYKDELLLAAWEL